jgi:hypothetical protein
MKPALDMPVMEAEDDAEPCWIDELSAAVERVVVATDALREDRQLTLAARQLLVTADEVGPGLTRRVFEGMAGVLLTTAADQQRRGRPGRQ